MCRLKEDHLPGFDCLSNEQILPLLLAMDPESILNCGRASPRLYKLVCTQMQCVTTTGVIEVKGAATEDEWEGMLEFLET